MKIHRNVLSWCFVIIDYIIVLNCHCSDFDSRNPNNVKNAEPSVHNIIDGVNFVITIWPETRVSILKADIWDRSFFTTGCNLAMRKVRSSHYRVVFLGRAAKIMVGRRFVSNSSGNWGAPMTSHVIWADSPVEEFWRKDRVAQLLLYFFRVSFLLPPPRDLETCFPNGQGWCLTGRGACFILRGEASRL